MKSLGGWTEAGSPDTMSVVYDDSCGQGTGHAILAPSRRAVRLAFPDRRRARPPVRSTPAAAPPRRPVRARPTHRHHLVPRRWRRRGLPTRLQRPVGRRTTRLCPGLPPALRRPAAAHASGPRRASALRHRRHAHAPLRPLRPGRRHPSQPLAWTGRREVRLRPPLGRPGLAGPSSLVGHPVPAAPRPALRPAPRTCPSWPRPTPGTSAPSWNWPSNSLAG